MEVVIVATRRIELLERCLASFSDKMFGNFDITRVLVNIDPIWGSKADQEAMKKLLHQHFANVHIFEPVEEHFTAAVKSLWLKTECERVFHLEEDWIALEEITPDMVDAHLSGDIKSLSLMNEAKNNTKNKPFHYKRHRPWYLPFKIEDKNRPHFGTSPSFWCGDFMRDCAKLMNTAFDPEKQFYENLNMPLQEFVRNKRCKFLFGNPHLIQDIGREWQEQNKIKKQITDGVSSWTSQ